MINRIKTCYVPSKTYNIYTTNIRKIISENGYDIYSMRKVLYNPIIFLKCKIFNFNWYEEASSKKEYIKKIIFLHFLKLFRKKIIFTLHNKHPHINTGNDWANKLTQKMCVISDVIIGHCPETREIVKNLCYESLPKIHIIPHPNYIHNYEDNNNSDFREKYSYTKDDIVFLFFGTISPYKNLELLITLFSQIQDQNIKLLIVGKTSDKKYKKQLEDKIHSCHNIILDSRYIPDKEIPLFYRTCDIVILPYQKSSYLNSGAVYLSFSLKKTVICPMIGTIKMIEDQSFLYSYDYLDESEHMANLGECIINVCKELNNDRSIVKMKGEKAFEYMRKNHCNEKISQMYKEVYDSI